MYLMKIAFIQIVVCILHNFFYYTYEMIFNEYTEIGKGPKNTLHLVCFLYKKLKFKKANILF